MQNHLKNALAAGQSQRGIWMSLSSPLIAEIVGDAGFDWVLVDCEHAPNDLPTLREQLQAMRGSSSSILARPPWNDMVLIKQFMDVGVQNFIIPYVQNPQEARDAVAATRYPPEGVRGVAGGSRASNFGRNKGYLKESNDAVTVIVQVETMEAMDELEAIGQVPGVDGVFIGPADLSASMGHLGNASVWACTIPVYYLVCDIQMTVNHRYLTRATSVTGRGFFRVIVANQLAWCRSHHTRLRLPLLYHLPWRERLAQ